MTDEEWGWLVVILCVLLGFVMRTSADVRALRRIHEKWDLEDPPAVPEEGKTP